MTPVGGAKGAALALVVELLTAAIASSNLGFEAGSFFTPDGPPPRIAQSFNPPRPRRRAGGDFGSRTEALLGAILDQPGTRLPRRAPARSPGAGETRRHRGPGLLHDDLVSRAG